MRDPYQLSCLWRMQTAWDNKLHRITMDGLYLGSMDAANNLTALQEKGITHILMVGERLKEAYPDLFKDTLNNLRRTTPTPDVRRGGVLVHCAAGVSRSGEVVNNNLRHAQGIVQLTPG
eukprot:3057960-Pyramimonas_sp.AAC.1